MRTEDAPEGSVARARKRITQHNSDAVAYHENDVKQLMVELNALYRGLLQGESMQASVAAMKAANEESGAVPFEIVGTAVATASAVESPIEEIVMGEAEEEAAENSAPMTTSA